MTMMAFLESKWNTRGVWLGAYLAASTKPWTSMRARSWEVAVESLNNDDARWMGIDSQKVKEKKWGGDGN